MSNTTSPFGLGADYENKSDVKSIMIVGVGGQGTLLASRLLGNVIQQNGFDVKVSEVHGMSQRGGSVVTYVKFGSEVYSPVIEKGEADTILAFETLEAARYLPYLKKGGKLIVNTQQIDPMPVITGAARYPEDLIEKLKGTGADVIDFDAFSVAEEAGSVKAVNVVLIGKLAKNSQFPKEQWEKAIVETVPEKFRELNLKAFELSYNQ